MKIGIITKIGKNYGALLQAYALKKTFDDKGIEAHIIKYTPFNSDKSYKIFKYRWGLRGIYANLKSLVHFKSIINGSRKMKEFREKYFSFIGDYTKNDSLICNPPDMDVFVTGSDQVWNPILSFDSAYYLSFKNTRKDQKLVSYAASIGLNEIPKVYENEFLNRIKKLDYITVRESRAKQLLDGYNIKSTVVPDPTLLLKKSDWENIAVRPKIKDKYILCYFVSFKKEYIDVVNKIKNKYGYKIVNLMTSESSSCVGDIKIRDASAQEFLGLFRDAEFVITSSYHGTIFSIIFEKDFCSMVYKQTSSRLVELLNSFQLENRIVNCSDNEDISRIFECISYSGNISKEKSKLRKIGMSAIDDIIKLK